MEPSDPSDPDYIFRIMVCLNLTDKDNTTLGGEQSQALYKEVSFVIYGFLLPMVCVFGMVGNLLNLTILTRRKLQKSFRTLEQAANLCLISLAVSDLMFCVFAFPTMFLPGDDLYDTKDILLTYRVYSTAIINVFIMISTWLTVAMSLERYLAICHPLRQDLYLTTRRIKIVIVLTYILSFIFNVPVLWRYEVQEICPRGLLNASSDALTTEWSLDASASATTLHPSPVVATPLPASASFSLGGGQGSSRVMDAVQTHLAAALSNASGLDRAGEAAAASRSKSAPDSSVMVGHGGAGDGGVWVDWSSNLSATTAPLSDGDGASTGDYGDGAEAGGGSVAFQPNQVFLWGSSQMDTAYRIAWAVVNNVIPLLLLVYFNVCLCRKIYRSYKMRQKFKQEHHSGHENSSHVLTVTLVVIVLMFFIFVAPSEMVIHAALITNTNNSYTYKTVEAVMNFMQSLNFSVNFILYCIISPYFRKTLKYIFCCGCYNIYQVSKQWRKEFETSLM